MKPVFGDFVRTHLKVQNKNPNIFVKNIMEKYHESWEDYKINRFISAALGNGWSRMPKDYTEALCNELGQSKYYWNRVNKKAHSNDDSVYNGVDMIIDLTTVSKWLSDKADLKLEVDTPISSRSLLGLFLLYGNAFRRCEVVANHKHIRLGIKGGYYTSSWSKRILWIAGRKWVEQSDKEAPVVLGLGDWYPFGDMSADARNVMCRYLEDSYMSIHDGIKEACIPLFGYTAADTESAQISVKWNKSLVSLWCLEIEQVDCNDPPVLWDDYLVR